MTQLCLGFNRFQPRLRMSLGEFVLLKKKKKKKPEQEQEDNAVPSKRSLSGAWKTGGDTGGEHFPYQLS